MHACRSSCRGGCISCACCLNVSLFLARWYQQEQIQAIAQAFPAMATPTLKPYIRLLRAADLSLIKELHHELFQFDIVVGDAALFDAVTNPRWLCLASVQALQGGGESLAGFVLSAVGSVSDFQQGDYFDDTQSSPDQSSASTSPSMGLEHLKLQPDDLAINVCLLATLPNYRRSGIASQLFSQVINSARNARAKAIFLHVLDDNTAALAFYHRLGFTIAARIPNFYQLSATDASNSSVYRDALLLSVPVSEVTSPASSSSSSGSSDAYVSTTAAYKAAVRRAAAAAAAAGTDEGGGTAGSSPAAAAPPPKMRGLMGRSSSTAAAAPRRKAASPGAAKPASPGSSQQGSLFGGMLGGLFKGGGGQQPAAPGQTKQQATDRTGSPGKDQGSKADAGGSASGILGALSGILGGTGKDSAGSQQQQQQRVVVNGEDLVMVTGTDGELYVVPAEAEAGATGSTNLSGVQGIPTLDATAGGNAVQGQAGAEPGPVTGVSGLRDVSTRAVAAHWHVARVDGHVQGRSCHVGWVTCRHHVRPNRQLQLPRAVQPLCHGPSHAGRLLRGVLH